MRNVMKKGFMKNVVIVIVLFIALFIVDYINLPTLLGVKVSNINWGICMGIISSMVTIVLYLITYNILDARTVQREENKKDISILLIKESYNECMNYIQFLNQESVEKYIVPKVDFNSANDTIINNLQNAPFSNENIIWDLVKDGQIEKKQMEGYLKIKEKFRKYINMRIIFFDAEQYYEPLKFELCNIINYEIRQLDKMP